jgi:hypothetical protein
MSWSWADCELTVSWPWSDHELIVSWPFHFIIHVRLKFWRYTVTVVGTLQIKVLQPMNLVLTFYKYKNRHWKFHKDEHIKHCAVLCTQRSPQFWQVAHVKFSLDDVYELCVNACVFRICFVFSIKNRTYSTYVLSNIYVRAVCCVFFVTSLQPVGTVT